MSNRPLNPDNDRPPSADGRPSLPVVYTADQGRPVTPRANDLDDPYSAFPWIPLLFTPYFENAVYGMGIRHVRPYALFLFDAWTNRSINDYFAIYLDDPVFPAAADLVADLDLDQHGLAVPEEFVPEGEVLIHGRVRRSPSGTESESVPRLILIKTTRPGGVDTDPGSPWHTGLVMRVEGFDEGATIGVGDVVNGLYCLIDMYEHCRQNDVIELSWDGVFVLHTVSPEEAAGMGPIRFLVDKSTIDRGGQLGKLTLRFRVRDVVENFSGEKYQYSKPYFLDAELDPSLLAPPFFLVDGEELVSGQIDFDTQSGSTFEVVVLTARQLPTPNPRHQITVLLLCMLEDGTTVPVPLGPVPDLNVGFTFIEVDPDIIAQVVGGSLRVIYFWETNDGASYASGSVTITVVGTKVLMPAPDVSPIELGLIPAGEAITITVPHYEPHDPGWEETLHITHVPPGGGGSIIYTQRQLAGAQGGTYTVSAADMAQFNGRGNIHIYYETNDGAAHILGGSALAIRQSAMLGAQVGERTADMPAPRLQGVIGNNVDPADVPGSDVRVTFTYLGTQAGDKLHWSCIGSGLGGSANGTITINAATAGKELPYPVGRDILDKNNNGSLRISYSLERDGPPRLVLRSEVLALTVGKGVQLDRPIIEGASLFPDELNPLAALSGGRVIVEFRPMLATDKISVDWLSIDGIGSATQQVDGNPATNEVSVLFDPRVIGQGIRDGGNIINVQYHFKRGFTYEKSEIVALRLLPLTGLPAPTIDDMHGPILELSKLGPTPLTRIPVWHFIHENQPMWMKYEGIDSNGNDWREDTYKADLVTDDGVTNGINQPTPVDKLKLLKDGSTLKISFWVSLAESPEKDTAILFGVREYTVIALEELRPVITNVTDSRGAEIHPGNLTTDTIVNLRGTASKGQQVEIFDGATPKGTATASDAGIWGRQVTGLPVGIRSLTAKALYGSGQVSAARSFRVIPPYTRPNITRVVRTDNGASVPSGSNVPRGVEIIFYGTCYPHPTKLRLIHILSTTGTGTRFSGHPGINQSSYDTSRYGGWPTNPIRVVYQATDTETGLTSTNTWTVNWV